MVGYLTVYQVSSSTVCRLLRIRPTILVCNSRIRIGMSYMYIRWESVHLLVVMDFLNVQPIMADSSCILTIFGTGSHTGSASDVRATRRASRVLLKQQSIIYSLMARDVESLEQWLMHYVWGNNNKLNVFSISEVSKIYHICLRSPMGLRASCQLLGRSYAEIRWTEFRDMYFLDGGMCLFMRNTI